MEIRPYSAKAQITAVILIASAFLAVGALAAWRLPLGIVHYSDGQTVATTTSSSVVDEETVASSSAPIIVHIQTPETVHAVYFTSWAAGTPSFRKGLLDVVSSTTVNSIVIDVKDYSGRVSFPIDDPLIKEIGSVQNRISDIRDLIDELHAKGIYVIGRVAVFQDPFIVKVHPDWAVLDKETGKQWRDSGGAYWADPTNEDMWKYIVAVAKGAYAEGFDEINFDYVRFPSDGAVGSAMYPSKNASTTKADSLKRFFAYVHEEMSSSSIPTSADIFGQTTSDPGDMGIGQHFENVLPYFDYVCPMVYPSHYINGFLGFPKPAEHPYAVVKYELDRAVERALAASSTPMKIRPWLQAFDLGAIYTPDMVHTQIDAVSDAGANGWLLWNAGSVYQRAFVMPYERATTTATLRASTVSKASSTAPLQF
jgi:hypothetical protein